jgi:hypothetical protein
VAGTFGQAQQDQQHGLGKRADVFAYDMSHGDILTLGSAGVNPCWAMP